ncbi:MAG TPA: hypothetical protein VL242_10900 [Sorangium sp.]|nr:hypothetical protein [Sorangium sp.]
MGTSGRYSLACEALACQRPGLGDETQQRYNVAARRLRSRDVREDGVMVPADLTPRWRQFLEGTRDLVIPEEHRRNEARLFG